MNRFVDSSKEPDRSGTLPVVLLAGPTAAGKTALSLHLCRAMNLWTPVEIVNADSMQVYRYMNVGTAKPTFEERRAVTHHLIDIANPDEHFDAARYLAVAGPEIEALRQRSILPLVVGGTGLYMRVLTHGLCSGPPSDPQVKDRLLSIEKSCGLECLYRDLLRLDPQSAEKIHPNDRQRIIRALEVFYIGGVALSALQKNHGFSQEIFPTVKIFINRERNQLYERINVRVERMLEAGLKAEVEELFSMGFGPELKSMQSIGYRQMAAHLAGAISMDEAAFDMKRETRRYAKRQITWFRGDSQFHCFHADDVEAISLHIRRSIEPFTG